MVLWKIAAFAMFGALIHNGQKTAQKDWEEQERRANAWCGFNDDISENDFYEMAKNAKKGIKQLKQLSIDGPIVYGVVRSHSGLSTWDFKIDFNDYGHLTGAYWLSSDNDDSDIPEHVADRIRSSIRIRNFSSTSEFYEPKDPVKHCKEAAKRVPAENEYKDRKDHKDNTILEEIVGLLFFLIFCFGLLFYIDYSQKLEHQRNNEIQISVSFDDLKSESVENAIKILDGSGFENININNKEDLIIGWFSKEGEIDSISINGNKAFSKGDWFPANAVVVITYHGFPEN